MAGDTKERILETALEFPSERLSAASTAPQTETARKKRRK